MNTSDKKIKTRFAPSPTGTLHIGSARTALFNYLIAKKYGGEMILRIEDTDKKRSKEEFEKNILDGLKWLGIEYSEFYRQSERGEIYKKYINILLESGAAYISEEEKDGKASSVIRFKNPNKKITFEDTVRGEITFDTEDLGDFVIAKDVEHPLYHLAVVIDDYDMGITHIVRGEDHISNTPRQILIQEAIGAERPLYTHLPLVLAPDKSKLSKRHGATSLSEFENEGYLPEAIVNFLALLGWSPEESVRQKSDGVFSLSEIIENFTLERIQKGGAIFDTEKLKWFNHQHLMKLSNDTLKELVGKYLPSEVKDLPQYTEIRLERVLPVIAERINVFTELTVLHEEGGLDYFFTQPEYSTKDILWKKDKDPEVAKKHLGSIIKLVGTLPQETYTETEIKEVVWEYATKEGRGSVLWPMRYALSGQERSPDPFTLAAIFGKEETIARLTAAILKLESQDKS